MKPSLHYLTVQDVMWINLQLTKKVQHYNFAKLEEATFYQYAYGESTSLIPQAGRFLAGFLKMHPFEAGNCATGFIATVAFLAINGHHLELPDATGAAWYESVKGKQSLATEAIQSAAKACHGAHHGGTPNVRAAISAAIEEYPCTVLELLSASQHPVSA